MKNIYSLFMFFILSFFHSFFYSYFDRNGCQFCVWITHVDRVFGDWHFRVDWQFGQWKRFRNCYIGRRTSGVLCLFSNFVAVQFDCHCRFKLHIAKVVCVLFVVGVFGVHGDECIGRHPRVAHLVGGTEFPRLPHTLTLVLTTLTF